MPAKGILQKKAKKPGKLLRPGPGKPLANDPGAHTVGTEGKEERVLSRLGPIAAGISPALQDGNVFIP